MTRLRLFGDVAVAVLICVSLTGLASRWSASTVSAQSDAEEAPDTCWQEKDLDYPHADRTHVHPDDSAAVAAAQAFARRQRDEAQARRGSDGAAYDGYDVDVASAHAREFEGLQPRDRRTRPDGGDLRIWSHVDDTGDLRAVLVAEEFYGPGRGWVVTYERWILPAIVCARLEARERPSPSELPLPPVQVEP